MNKLASRIFTVVLMVVILAICSWRLVSRQLISVDGDIVEMGDSEDMVMATMPQVMSGEPLLQKQDDERIIQYIWKYNHILPPSKQEYNLKEPRTDPSRGQGQMIRKLLKNMRNGFFVEAGALDGETRSNTLYLEKNLNWKGLLVEGDPSNFEMVKTKNRKAWISNTCLAVKSYPHKVEYKQSFNTGRILNQSPEKEGPPRPNTAIVQCMPLFSLLTAINVTTIDYFSLDVEGSELKVLKTIPFDKVFIKTLSIEFEHTEGGKSGILNFMKEKGYVLAGEVTPPKYSWANDVIMIHKSLREKS